MLIIFHSYDNQYFNFVLIKIKIYLFIT